MRSSAATALLALALFGCRRAERADPAPAAVASAASTSAAVANAAGAQAAPRPDAAAEGDALSPDAAPAQDATPDAPAERRPMRKEDWEIAIGKWTFADDEATCECKATSSLIYWKQARPRSFDASVEVWFLSVESSAGIIFRARGEDFYEDATFYQYEWYTRGTHHDKRLSLMIKNPFWVQIVTPRFPEAPLGKWIRLRVRAEGERLQTWLDDELVFDKVDRTLLRSGRVGLHVFQPRQVRLRDFRLTVLDAAP